MMDNVSYVQGLAQPLVIIHHRHVSTASVTILGTRWHDFFITLFRYFINLFYSFPFLEGYRLEKGHIVPVLCSHS